MYKQTWKCCNHYENEYFLTTDRLTSILDVTSSSRDLVNDSYKAQNYGQNTRLNEEFRKRNEGKP